MRKTYKSFLVINPFGIGDVLFSTPLLRNLKTVFPDSKISYLCNRRTNVILKDNPLIDKTFIYERDEFESERKFSRTAWIKKYWRFIRRIKKESIDVSIDLSLNTKFGFFCWAAGIRKRVGLNYKDRGRFLTDKILLKGFDDKHVSEYYLDLLKLLGIKPERTRLEVYLNTGSKQWTEQFFSKNNITPKDLVIGIAPCGGQAFGDKAWMKRWDIDKFAELANRLNTRFGAKIFIFAGKNEKEEVLRMTGALNDPVFYHEFTDSPLDKIIALVDRCSLFIGNDTGPLRFADALNKPIIGIFGPVDEKVYGFFPKAEKKKIIAKDIECRPCYKRFKLPECGYGRKCLSSITVEEVFSAVRELI